MRKQLSTTFSALDGITSTSLDPSPSLGTVLLRGDSQSRVVVESFLTRLANPTASSASFAALVSTTSPTASSSSAVPGYFDATAHPAGRPRPTPVSSPELLVYPPSATIHYPYRPAPPPVLQSPHHPIYRQVTQPVTPLHPSSVQQPLPQQRHGPPQTPTTTSSFGPVAGSSHLQSTLRSSSSSVGPSRHLLHPTATAASTLSAPAFGPMPGGSVPADDQVLAPLKTEASVRSAWPYASPPPTVAVEQQEYAYVPYTFDSWLSSSEISFFPSVPTSPTSSSSFPSSFSPGRSSSLEGLDTLLEPDVSNVYSFSSDGFSPSAVVGQRKDKRKRKDGDHTVQCEPDTGYDCVRRDETGTKGRDATGGRKRGGSKRKALSQNVAADWCGSTESSPDSSFMGSTSSLPLLLGTAPSFSPSSAVAGHSSSPVPSPSPPLAPVSLSSPQPAFSYDSAAADPSLFTVVASADPSSFDLSTLFDPTQLSAIRPWPARSDGVGLSLVSDSPYSDSLPPHRTPDEWLRRE